MWRLVEFPERLRLLIRDREQKFTASIDEVFRRERIDTRSRNVRAVD
jgi:hypothetical protein